MSYLRNQTHSQQDDANSTDTAHSNTTSPTHGARTVPTMDLLANRRTRGGIVTIKSSIEDDTRFREWTYYLTSQPSSSMALFTSFVQKQYCSVATSTGDVLVPFERVQLFQAAGIITLDVMDLVPNLYEAGNWVLLTGMPDGLPLFFFAVSTPTPDKDVLFINHSTGLVNRMKSWTTTPTHTTLQPLSRLPALMIN